MSLFVIIPASILYKSIAGRYRPVSYPDGPITARCRFIKNAYWDMFYVVNIYVKTYNFKRILCVNTVGVTQPGA